MFKKLFHYTNRPSSRKPLARLLDVFKKTQAIASQQNARVIAFNRRGYAPSSAYTEAETKSLTGSKEAQEKFLQQEGHDYATVVAKLIGQYKLGKVVVVGWSLSAGWISAMVGNLSSLPSEVISSLEGHLDTVILHGAPSLPPHLKVRY